MNLLEKLWKELDSITERLIEGKDVNTPDEKLKLQGEAIGLAKAIIVFHRPFFDDGIKAVSAEALKRYKAFSRGEQYETVGLGSRIYEAPKAAPAGVVRNTPEIDPITVEIQKIPHNHQKVIKESQKDAAIMAKLFGCSEEAVRRIRGE